MPAPTVPPFPMTICPCSIDLSTGLDSNIIPIGQGIPESRWTIVGPPGSGLTGGMPSAWGQATTLGWMNPAGLGAGWIGPDPFGFGNGAVGVYSYSIVFRLDFCKCSDFVLNLYFAADNTATFLLNGKQLNVPAIASPTSFNSLNGPFTFTGPFVSGNNTLTVQVNNIGGATGLFINATVDGACKGPDLAFNLATGENSNNTPIAYGAADTDWILSNGPGAGYPHPAYAATPVPAWVAGGQLSNRWITPSNWGGGIPSTESNGDYTYAYAFTGLDLELYDITYASIAFASDNEVSFYMNDNTAAFATGGPNAFGAWSTSFTIPPADFQHGPNVLRAVVHNSGGPSGLRVRGFVDANYKKHISINVGTGTLGPDVMPTGTSSVAGQADPDWKLLVGPYYSAQPVYCTKKLSGWTSAPGAVWMSPDGQLNNITGYAGNYVYELQFKVDLEHFQNYAISFSYAADNYVSFSLYDSSGGITFLGGTNTITSFSSLSGPIGSLAPFPKSGTYLIRATVYNKDFWTALLVSGSVTADNICQ
ncbi:MAG: hypothetical protein HY286_03380 [Planctomycetes bacterium]|nr:hypothetical protein [Planctomycetota bacterium]